jgi:hypothetical protein
MTKHQRFHTHTVFQHIYGHCSCIHAHYLRLHTQQKVTEKNAKQEHKLIYAPTHSNFMHVSDFHVIWVQLSKLTITRMKKLINILKIAHKNTRCGHFITYVKVSSAHVIWVQLPKLAITDIKMFIRKVVQDLVDVRLFLHVLQNCDQIAFLDFAQSELVVVRLYCSEDE